MMKLLVLLQAAMHEAALNPDPKSYATVIKACGKLGLWQKALELKSQMRQCQTPRLVYNTLLMTLNMCNQLEAALEVRAEMEAADIGLDGFSYFALLQNVCKVKPSDGHLTSYTGAGMDALGGPASECFWAQWVNLLWTGWTC